MAAFLMWESERMNWHKRILLSLGLLIYLATGMVFAQNKTENLSLIKTQLALEYLQTEDYRSAAKAIEEAIKVDPRFMSAWLVRGHIYQKLKVLPKADESFRRALSIEPGSAEANNNYGWFLCNNSQADKSIAHFDRALSDPTYPEPYVALMNKGICLSKLNQFNESNTALLAALNRAPGFTPAVRELVNNNLNAKNGKLAELYFEQYRNKVRNLSAEDLYLGIRVGRLINNYDWVARFGSQLRENYPYSPELQKLLSGQ